MGYSENCCQLCAVSINLARLRTKNEPASAGWGSSGLAYYSGEAAISRCSVFEEQSGCENVEKDEDQDGDDWVHFPGRGCTFIGGYNGWKISAEEMKGMNLPRYIVKKPTNAAPDKDETDYEKSSDFFITSQTTCPPDDFEPGELAHVRYGVRNFFSQNYKVGVDFQESRWGVPVHDACWKIFERVSRLKTGEVDLQGFMALWFRQACGTCGFQNLKHEEVIQKCREQWWIHEAGTEYLGANPHDIPGFILALQEAYNNRPDGDGAFRVRPYVDNQNDANATDAFSSLPTELRNMILSHLSSKDIGSLRLTSRSFRQLPKQIVLRLIQDELPWFWEFDELKAADDEFWKRFYSEKDPEGSNPPYIKERIVRSREGNFTKDVNWLEVYKKLCSLKKGMLGVRNRARIWKVVEEVVSRIGHLREQGWSQVEPTNEDGRTEVVNNESNCPRCSHAQIERGRKWR